MGYYATCDVKGCDEITQVDAFGAHPKEWLCLHFEVAEDEKTDAVRQARMQQIIPQLPPGIDPESVMMPHFRVTRNVIMCSKHDMPEFDPEPPGGGRHSMVLGES